MAHRLAHFASTTAAELAATEERLRREVETARERFEHASAEFEQVRLLARELGLNTENGSFALHYSAERFRVSARNYRQALTRFGDFILRAKFPAE